jgi:Flp pilus assembly protein CpaB
VDAGWSLLSAARVLAHLQQVPHEADANHAIAAAHATLHKKQQQAC